MEVPPASRSRGPRVLRAGIARLLLTGGVMALLMQAVLTGTHWWQDYLPHYAVGSLPSRNVTTPAALRVVDLQATAIQQATESQKLPPLYRLDSRTAEQAVERFREEHTEQRARFLSGLGGKWTPPLTAADVQSAPFAEYVAAFRLTHPDQPLSDELAANWALNLSADPLDTLATSALREAFRHYIIDDGQAADTAGEGEVFISAARHLGGVTSPGALEQQAIRLPQRVLVPLGAARDQLRRELNPNGSSWANHVARFVTANVTYDALFTRTAREEIARNVKVEVRFQPGDSLTQVSHPVTEVQSAALESLRAYYGAMRHESAWTQWWLGGFGLALLLAGILVRRRLHQVMEPPVAEELTSASPITASDARASAVHRDVIQQLTSWLKLGFVQRLIRQRNEAVAAQDNASHQVAELNERLTKLHPEIRERVAEYERRIAQLERDLSTANEVSRELIKTKISLVRKELEIERARSTVAWN